MGLKTRLSRADVGRFVYCEVGDDGNYDGEDGRIIKITEDGERALVRHSWLSSYWYKADEIRFIESTF